MNFRTRLDITNRQVKQYEKTDVSYSGASIFGLPYSALTSGVDLTTTATTFNNPILVSTYSGNTGTTVYTFGDNRMYGDAGSLSALTPSNSGTTQFAGPTWVGYSPFVTVDGYSGYSAYSAVTYDIIVTSMIDLGSGAYSGSLQSDFSAYSGESLDFTGSTIWVDVSGITRTDELVVSKDAQVGYVFTCLDVYGKGGWVSNSSGNTFTTGATLIDTILYFDTNDTLSAYTANLSTLEGPFTYSSAGIINTTNAFSNSATGNFSSILGGSGNTSTSEYSTIVGGINNTISGSSNGSIISGGINNIISGSNSYAEGDGNISSGGTSHAEGSGTIAGGFVSHAEGFSTTASNSASHAEGLQTEASGTYSHAEGQFTTASADSSHSQNRETTASGVNSHAGGHQSIASGETSFIHSSNSIVTGARSAVIGGSNITGSTDDMVYVPDLIIDGLTNVTDLQTDSNGQIIDGASDITLKNKVEGLCGSLDKILKLKPVSFEWVPEMNLREGKVFGLIAQDVQKIIPEIVRERSKGGGTLTLEYKEIIPWIISAIQELVSGETFTRNEIILKTQTLASEDNNIELNYGGTHDTANGGGIKVLNSVKDGINSEIKVDEHGNWIITPSLTSPKITIPEYTPSSTVDEMGSEGNVVWDDNYIYIKRNNGWGRCKLEDF
jgi:hypothetical protein